MGVLWVWGDESTPYFPIYLIINNYNGQGTR